MQEIRRELRMRMQDILAYLRMLRFTGESGGAVSMQSRDGKLLPVSQNMIHVLKAGVFLHLYNLVESTVFAGLVHIAEQIKAGGVRFNDLNECWQRAWVSNKLDKDLSLSNRSTAALDLCRAVAEDRTMEIKPKIGVGNLDDRRIEDLARQFGISLILDKNVKAAIKHEVLNNLGFLGLVRKRRNELAHGYVSFSDSGKDYSTAELTRWAWATYQYLKGLLASFDAYVQQGCYRRSAGGP